MRNICFLLLITISFLNIEASQHASEIVVSKYFKKDKFQYDAYGNVHIYPKAVSEKTLKSLIQIREKMQSQFPRIGVFVHIPVVFGGYAEKIKTMQYVLHDIDCEKQEIVFLFRNGRGIPNIHNSCAGNAVFIFRENCDTGKKELLIVNDIDKPFCNVVGGCVDNLERVADGAVREVKEEIGLTVKVADLKLLTISNRVDEKLKTNKFGFFYACEVFEGTPKPDGKEVVDFKWIPLDEVLSDGFQLFGKPFNKTYIKVLKAEYASGMLQERDSSHEYQVASASLD